MNAVVRLRPGCTCSRDRDVRPYCVLRDRCRSDFAQIRWPHNDMHVTTGDGVQLAVRDYDPPSRTQTVVFLRLRDRLHHWLTPCSGESHVTPADSALKPPRRLAPAATNWACRDWLSSVGQNGDGSNLRVTACSPAVSPMSPARRAHDYESSMVGLMADRRARKVTRHQRGTGGAIRSGHAQTEWAAEPSPSQGQRMPLSHKVGIASTGRSA